MPKVKELRTYILRILSSPREQNLTYVTVTVDKISGNPYMNLLGGEDLLISIKPMLVSDQIFCYWTNGNLGL